MEMDKQMTLKPRLSEKTYEMSKTANVYVFSVPKKANRAMISRSVESQFQVTVESIRITNSPSKPKRSIRQGGRKVSKGRQPGLKKAYVTVKKGDIIPIFAAEDEERAKTEKLTQQLQRSKK